MTLEFFKALIFSLVDLLTGLAILYVFHRQSQKLLRQRGRSAGSHLQDDEEEDETVQDILRKLKSQT